MDEGNEKINTWIDVEIADVREEIIEVNKRGEQQEQDLKRTREEAVSYTHLDVYKRQLLNRLFLFGYFMKVTS